VVMSGDPALAGAAAGGDLYAAVARDAFSGDRQRAKIALLAAMYGQTSGEAGQLLAVMRRRFPVALALVESAARTGEAGGVVRSRLGRTSPAPSAGWFADESADPDDGASPDRRAARSWGRFTRNFVIQASAADWALAMLAALRRELAAMGGGPRLVFFQHDEVVVHTPEELAPAVEAAVASAAAEARRLVFGSTGVPLPLPTHAVRSYAEAK
jgi:DNA polymerase I-like protein with 3'-5' exonuclease and polymerase domains